MSKGRNLLTPCVRVNIGGGPTRSEMVQMSKIQLFPPTKWPQAVDTPPATNLACGASARVAHAPMLQDVAVACGMLGALQAAAKPRQGLPLLAQADRTALQELEASKQRRRKNAHSEVLSAVGGGRVIGRKCPFLLWVSGEPPLY